MPVRPGDSERTSQSVSDPERSLSGKVQGCRPKCGGGGPRAGPAVPPAMPSHGPQSEPAARPGQPEAEGWSESHTVRRDRCHEPGTVSLPDRGRVP